MSVETLIFEKGAPGRRAATMTAMAERRIQARRLNPAR